MKGYPVKYRTQLIPMARTQRPGYILRGGRAASITVHNTANPNATAANHADWLTRENTRASAHIFVDDNEAVLTIPLNEHAWHAGTNAGNTTSIGIEVCEFSDRARQDKTDDNAQRLIADMLTGKAPAGWNLTHLTIKDVRTHQSWMQYGTSGKYCPRMLLPWWSRFIAETAALITKEVTPMYWLIVTIFRAASDARDYAAWCVANGIAALPSGDAAIAHGNDEKSRKAEAEAERRGGVCPFGRVITTQESYKHFTRRTPLVLPESEASSEHATIAEYESRFDRIAALLTAMQQEIPK